MKLLLAKWAQFCRDFEWLGIENGVAFAPFLPGKVLPQLVLVRDVLPAVLEGVLLLLDHWLVVVIELVEVLRRLSHILGLLVLPKELRRVLVLVVLVREVVENVELLVLDFIWVVLALLNLRHMESSGR